MIDCLFDQLLHGTPFRGLVRHGGVSLCAYIGVPEDHWAADMEEFDFDCHGGITLRTLGDGVSFPKGWYWYGWDYGHFGDKLNFPPEVQATLDASFKKFPRLSRYPEHFWKLEEVILELVDVATALIPVFGTVNGTADGALWTAKLRLHRDQ